MMKLKGLEADLDFGTKNSLLFSVREVNRSSIVGVIDGELCALLSEDRRLLPNSIRVGARDFLVLQSNLKTDSEVVFECEFKKLTSLQANFVFFQKENFHNFYFQLCGFMDLAYDDDINLEEILWQTIKSLMAKTMPINYLGYGIGSTPSFDDALLGGFLLVQLYQQSEVLSALKAYIRKNLNKTTDASQSQLYNAIEKQKFPQILLDLFNAPSFQVLLPFLRHGGSSGLDILLGIKTFYECLILKNNDRSKDFL